MEIEVLGNVISVVWKVVIFSVILFNIVLECNIIEEILYIMVGIRVWLDVRIVVRFLMGFADEISEGIIVWIVFEISGGIVVWIFKGKVVLITE